MAAHPERPTARPAASRRRLEPAYVACLGPARVAGRARVGFAAPTFGARGALPAPHQQRTPKRRPTTG